MKEIFIAVIQTGTVTKRSIVKKHSKNEQKKPQLVMKTKKVAHNDVNQIFFTTHYLPPLFNLY